MTPSSFPSLVRYRDASAPVHTSVDDLISDCHHLIKIGSTLNGVRFKIEPYSFNHVSGFTMRVVEAWTLARLVSSFNPEADPALQPSLNVAVHPNGSVSLRCYGEDPLDLAKSLDGSTPAKLQLAQEILSGNIFDWIAHYSAVDPVQAKTFGLRHAHLG